MLIEAVALAVHALRHHVLPHLHHALHSADHPTRAVALADHAAVAAAWEADHAAAVSVAVHEVEASVDTDRRIKRRD